MSAYSATDKTATRVLFYGVTGSGKSVASRRYAEAAKLPLYSADEEVGWLPGWHERSFEEQQILAQELAAKDTWVLDGAYHAWKDIILERADLIVALDYPRWLSLGRLLRRTVKQFINQDQICNGNFQTLKRIFGSKSIILWHFQTYSNKRKVIASMVADPAGPSVIVIRHPRDLESLLLDVARSN